MAVGKRLKLQGFILTDHYADMPAFVVEMAGWVREGRIHWRETIDEGIEATPGAFLKLFTGDNVGKMLVRL
jgi:NADPH-dependent curcumin reductase CurA